MAFCRSGSPVLQSGLLLHHLEDLPKKRFSKMRLKTRRRLTRMRNTKSLRRLSRIIDLELHKITYSF